MRVEGAAAPAPGRSIRVHADGNTIAVFNVGGRLFGVGAKCTHVGGPLDQGPLSGTIVTCPWHGSQFDLETGAVKRGPAMKPVRAYRVRAEDSALVIEPA